MLYIPYSVIGPVWTLEEELLSHHHVGQGEQHAVDPEAVYTVATIASKEEIVQHTHTNTRTYTMNTRTYTLNT
jgi:hypothetical protein